MRFAFTIQYSGKDFSGFQTQKDARSVQSELEKALKIYFQENLRVHCAGRTDTGVHAAGQVIHFEIGQELFDKRSKTLEKIIYHLNCILPHDVSIIYGSQVDEDFHARFSCLGREYVYEILNSTYRMALLHGRQLWIQFPLNVEKMQNAANVLLGEHDFAAFTKAIYQKTNERTVRRIDEIKIIRRQNSIYFYYNGSGFLHNMIRIITGTLVMAGKGLLSPDEMKNILEKKDRQHYGKTLPAFPLTFLNAKYANYHTPRELLPYHEMGISKK